MLLTWCFLLCLITGSVPLTIDDINSPRSVLAGEKVVLQCKVQLTDGESKAKFFVKWWFWLAEDSNNRTQIYQRSNGIPPQLIDDMSSWSLHEDIDDTIVLKEAEPRNTGVYQCEVSVGTQEDRREHPLFVYTPGSGPQLNITKMEGDELFAECSTDHASPEPKLFILVDGFAVDANDTEPEEQSDGTWNVSTVAIVPASDATVVTCELQFLNSSVPLQKFVADYQLSRDGCVKLGTTILMPVTMMVIMQLMYSLQQHI